NMFPLFIMEDGSRGAAAEKSLTDHIQDGASYVVGVLVGVSSSVWAVSSFSLEEVKYKEIISKSKEFAGGLLKNFNGIGGEPELTFDGSPYKVTLGGIEKDDGEDSSYRSFSDGYKAGVDYYFKMAEKE
ncbi:MAG: hypothetical protein D6B27_12180, partial [Gammaproteobacteria bacterium]